MARLAVMFHSTKRNQPDTVVKQFAVIVKHYFVSDNFKKVKKLFSFFAVVTVLLFGAFFIGANKVDMVSSDASGYSDHRTLAIQLPDSLNFAGEEVPLSDFEVRQRLDRELLVNTYWQSKTLLIIKEYNQVVPLIKPILKKYNVPLDFIYLAIAESGLQNVISVSGAEGVWQFLPETAESYGLEISNSIDERYNIEKSTEAACHYILEAKKKFGSWTLAAASFNTGMGNLDKAIQQQKQNNYYNLYLNDEASRYIFRILALKEIMEHPKAYGYYLNKGDLYDPLIFKTVSVDSSINNLALFALQQGTNYKLLKYFNPWLRSSSLQITDGKSYTLKICTDSTSEFSSRLFDDSADVVQSVSGVDQ